MRTHSYLPDMARPQPDSVLSLTDKVAIAQANLTFVRYLCWRIIERSLCFTHILNRSVITCCSLFSNPCNNWMTRHSGFAPWQEHRGCSDHVCCIVHPASSASEALSRHYSFPSMELTTRLYLKPKLRTCDVIPPFPRTSSSLRGSQLSIFTILCLTLHVYLDRIRLAQDQERLQHRF
jgi:hypothetical protein